MRTVHASMVILGMALPVPAQDEAPARDDPVSVLERWAPALVTVRATVEARLVGPGGSQEMERRREIPAVVVHPSGLVMLSNSAFRAPDPDPERGFRMELVPTDFRVVLDEDDEDGQPAFLAATYDNLGLAFVKVRDLGDRDLRVVDFGAGTEVRLGQEVVGLGRLGKGYDYAPFYDRTTVSGRVRKPRRAWIFEDVPASVGLPVFDLGGAVAGGVARIDDPEEEDGSMFAPSRSGRSMMVAAPVLAALVEQARKQAAELEEKGLAEAPAGGEREDRGEGRR